MRLPLTLIVVAGLLAVVLADDLVLHGTLRDMPDNGQDGATIFHPDFQTFCCALVPGIVANQLGPNGKPVKATWDGNFVTSDATFATWYTDSIYNAVPNVPNAYFTKDYAIVLTDSGDNIYSYTNYNFFIADGWGFGSGYYENYGHNFGFTYEIHATFIYQADDSNPPNLNFCGDDDVWIFINGQLALDLGGVHGLACDSFTLNDAFASQYGLVDGQPADWAIFFAERHTTGSDFVITVQNMELVSNSAPCPENATKRRK